MEKLNVLITFPVKEEKRKLIEDAAPDAQYTYLAGYSVEDEKTELTAEHMAGADVILGSVPPAMLQHCRRLKFLQIDWSGVKPYLGGVLPEGAAFACATGAYGLAISEYMLTCIRRCFHTWPTREIISGRRKAWCGQHPVRWFSVWAWGISAVSF